MKSPPFADAADLSGRELRYAPPHKVNIGVQWLNPWVNAKMDVIWSDKQFTDDANIENEKADAYVLTDLKIWRDLNAYFTTSLSVKNLFDEEHTITPSGTGSIGGTEYSKSSYNPGRVLTGMLTWQF